MKNTILVQDNIMEITIDFKDVLERCVMESAFIGRTAELHANDELRYATDDEVYSRHYVGNYDIVRIRGGDTPLLMTYIREGAHKLECAWCEYMSATGCYTSETVVWEFKLNDDMFHQPPIFNPFQNNYYTQDNNPSEDGDTSWLAGTIEDILATYALSRWLHDKQPDLSSVYLQRYENTTLNVTLSLTKNTLRAPRKRFENQNHLVNTFTH